MSEHADVVVIGGGQAGLAAGYHLRRAGLDFVILDGQDRAVGSFRVPLATLNRHAFVTGATGSGKSQTVRHLLEQLTEDGPMSQEEFEAMRRNLSRKHKRRKKQGISR